MSRVCEVTGKKVMYGNNVSHAHNKTRRRFDINLQKKTFWVETLNKKVTLKVSAKGLKIIDNVLSNCQNEVLRYKNGEKKLIGFFIGQVNKETKGKVSHEVVIAELSKKLKD